MKGANAGIQVYKLIATGNLVQDQYLSIGSGWLHIVGVVAQIISIMCPWRTISCKASLPTYSGMQLLIHELGGTGLPNEGDVDPKP